MTKADEIVELAKTDYMAAQRKTWNESVSHWGVINGECYQFSDGSFVVNDLSIAEVYFRLPQ